MGTTPNIGLFLLGENQQGAEITFNESMYKLDAVSQLSVIDVLGNPAFLSPATGDVYLVDATSAGDFAGMANHIAYYILNQWKFIPPREGMLSWVQDTDTFMVYTGTLWQEMYGKTSSISGHFTAPIDQDYCLTLVASEAFKITKTTGVTGSGSCSVAIKLNAGTASTARAITPTQAEFTEDIDVVAADKITLVVSLSAEPIDLQFTIGTLRTSF